MAIRIFNFFYNPDAILICFNLNVILFYLICYFCTAAWYHLDGLVPVGWRTI